MKEHLWSINICIDDADWQMNQDGSKSPPGETKPSPETDFNLTRTLLKSYYLGSLSDTEHFHIISLLHYMFVSEFEKNLTTSELMDSK